MRILGVLVILAPALASAQPEPRVAPNLYGTGNLRISMACANYDAVPQAGLRVSVDGAELKALRSNGMFGTAYDDDGNPYSTWTTTDTGYLANAGEHHITVTAPGCEQRSADVVLAADHAEVISGRLAVSDPDWMGTVAVPNGGGITMGMVSMPTPTSARSDDISGDRYGYDPVGTSLGGWLSTSWERGSWEIAQDLQFAVGSISGTVAAGGSINSFAGNTYQWSHAWRVGRRIALRDVSFGGGLGLGYNVWFDNSSSNGPNNVDGSWFVPVWAAVTIKPSCHWGVQGLAEYNVHPTATDNDAMAFGVGVIYQPNDACSQPPSFHVAPDA